MNKSSEMYVAIDVDGTVTKANISFAFGRYLFKQNKISRIQAGWLVWFYILFSIGVISVSRLHEVVFCSLFQGIEKGLIEKEADAFFTICMPALFRKGVCEEIMAYKEKGERLVLLSSSPDFLVSRVANYLSIPEWYATEYVVDAKGLYGEMGRVITGSEKARIVSKEKEKAASVIAYTDSMQDLPLLKVADEVVAVYPSRRLRAMAWKNGWRVVDG